MTGPLRLTRRESRDQTRQRLLDGARHVFARGGYAGASVDAIAAEAGFSKGALYSNFESKERLFLDLLARHMAEEAAQLEHLVAADTSAAVMLDSIDAWLDRMHDDADWALLAVELQLHARRSPVFATEYDALHLRHRERLAGLIARLFARSGRCLPAPAVHLAAVMMALAHGLVLQRTGSGKDEPTGGLIRTVLRSLLDSAPTQGSV